MSLLLPVILLSVRSNHVRERRELVVLAQVCPELRLELALDSLLSGVFVGAEFPQNSCAAVIDSLKSGQSFEDARELVFGSALLEEHIRE